MAAHYQSKTHGATWVTTHIFHDKNPLCAWTLKKDNRRRSYLRHKLVTSPLLAGS